MDPPIILERFIKIQCSADIFRSVIEMHRVAGLGDVRRSESTDFLVAPLVFEPNNTLKT